uniref:Uncharacterized protein n=1 Tax=Cucumis melo TaxID=3656 RepID=A0A9I9EHG8_CUCME
MIYDTYAHKESSSPDLPFYISILLNKCYSLPNLTLPFSSYLTFLNHSLPLLPLLSSTLKLYPLSLILLPSNDYDEIDLPRM